MTHELPQTITLVLEKVQDLHYGENPHQTAALYAPISQPRRGIPGAKLLHGKELSHNNLLDADAARNLIREFDYTAAAVIKHTNPCGVARADTLVEAYVLARESDPVSAFGSVVALNRTVDTPTATEIHSTFVEVVFAPDYTSDALKILTQKKNIRLLIVGPESQDAWTCRTVDGGFLIQERDLHELRAEDLAVVTRLAPTARQMESLLFGWRVVKHVKSNAIVFCDAQRTLGIGAGQMSRVDSVKFGAQKAFLPLEGCALASDAFFPFPDGVVAAAEYGVRAIIQPGGSVRDKEVIEAADAHGIAMVFTGIRHFRH